jgi:hypothetical protein
VKANHTTLDGSLIDVDGPLDLTVPSTVYSVWLVDGERVDFGAGNVSFGEHAIGRLGDAQFDEEYSLQGGRLRIAHDVLHDEASGYSGIRRWAIWEGQSHSLYTGFAEVESATLIALLDQFIISEVPTGLTLVPKNPATTQPVRTQQYPRLYKVVPDVGVLDVHELSDVYKGSLPKWKGQAVRGGQLYRLDPSLLDDGRKQERFVLVGASAITWIEAQLGVSTSDYLDGLSQVLVEWRRVT